MPSCRVLVVGAGGIGCELLKTLVQASFEAIHVIDLDTIDVSNLNRQFLFRKHHVGASKAEIASQAVMQFNPKAKVTFDHGNIKDGKFDVDFFKSFKIVFNALDNVGARQHVNRLCVAAEVPMIDAGSTGYLGQSTVFLKGETECYDCRPKLENTQKFPICTIRSTPEKPVHCIVWAKELFKLMFGVAEESDLADLKIEDGSTSHETLKQDRLAKSIVMNAVTSLDAGNVRPEELAAYCTRVFDAVFCKEIKVKLEMTEGYKHAKCKPPVPLSREQCRALTQQPTAEHAMAAQRIWSVAECGDEFERSICELRTKRTAQLGSLVFDKDDEPVMRFVTAAANLRCHVFSIERKSPFDVKGIAGNIVHAVATTNAIVAGLQVIEAVKLLKRMDAGLLPVTTDCCLVTVNKEPFAKSGGLLWPDALAKPSPTCVTCSHAMAHVSINTAAWTLGDFVSKVLKKRLGMNEPTLMLQDGPIYEEGAGLSKKDEVMWRANAEKTLENCPAGGIRSGTIMSVDDFSQNLEFKIIFHHVDKVDGADGFVLSGDQPQVGLVGQGAANSAKGRDGKEDDDVDDDVVIADDAGQESPSKKAKVPDDDDVIVIE